jgi:phospholipid/cholesterol/gamma-HCH transport system substrate-binding protein
MKRENINYALVGLAVLTALVLLLGTLFYVTGRTGAATRYYVEYGNVTGLSYGAPVFYEGFRIGQVSGIEPLRGERTRYRVQLSVREDWPIPEGSLAHLQSSGLLADVSVGIREGAGPGVIQPGARIGGVEGADIFSAMNELAGELTVLTRERIRPLVESLGQRIETLGQSLDEHGADIIADTQRLLTRLNAAAEGAEQLLGSENRAAIAGILGDVRGVSRELRASQQRVDLLLDNLNATVEENRPELRQSVQDLERSIGAVAQRIETMTRNLESASRNMDEFTREIRRHPNRLLFTPPADPVE